jgi:hypothetical protein
VAIATGELLDGDLPRRARRLAFGRFLLEVITFVMSRKMMVDIKRLAERDSRSTCTTASRGAGAPTVGRGER